MNRNILEGIELMLIAQEQVVTLMGTITQKLDKCKSERETVDTLVLIASVIESQAVTLGVCLSMVSPTDEVLDHNVNNCMETMIEAAKRVNAAATAELAPQKAMQP